MAKGTCSIEGCTRPKWARGWCNTHYARWRKHGDPVVIPVGRRPGPKPKGNPACSIEGCERPTMARGWCRMHYYRWQEHGDPTVVRRRGDDRDPICSIEGCGQPTRSQGWCSTHYYRWRNHGDPNVVLIERTGECGCSIEGCERPKQARGWCSTHYMRWQQHGDPTVVLPGGRPRRPEGLSPTRYRRVYLPGHPIADVRGNVAEHRMVVYDAIGPGTHPCEWCATPVRWEGRWPRDRDALVVDHLDWDKSNNDLSNLVPSCNLCNIARSEPLAV